MGVRPHASMGVPPPLPDRFSSLRPSSPEKRQLAPTTGNQIPQRTPTKSDMGSYVPRSLPHPRASLSGAVELTPSRPKPLLPNLHSNDLKPAFGSLSRTAAPKPMIGSKNLAARPSKPRPSMQAASEEPTETAPGQRKMAVPVRPRKPSAKISSVSSRTSSTLPSSLLNPSPAPSSAATASSPKTTPQKSSTSLRETIAKAKAARLNAIKAQSKGGNEDQQGEDDFAIDLGGSNKGLLKKRIAMARTDGRLNIAAMKLSEIPPEVLTMYDPDATDAGDGAWYESVDLVKLIAADNDIQTLGDNVFQDDELGSEKNPDEDYKGNMFGGLETLDLHGNRIQSLPLGLRRLQRLAILNLSKNRVNNAGFGVISQLHYLRELRLTDNELQGMLDSRILELHNLEILDLSSNKLSALPDGIDSLSSLHTLILAGNRMTSIPLKILASTGLAVLDVSQNKLQGALLPRGARELPSLRSLDISNNALTSITDGPLPMPSLKTLNAMENRLQALPDMTGCDSLVTLSVTGNRINAIPEGLVTLKALKNVDFSRNDVTKIDERFGLLDSLTVFRIANNPLRERKFLTLNTEDLKRDLRAKLVLAEDEGTDLGDKPSFDGATQDKPSAATKTWPIKPGGILDRSSTNTNTIDASELEPLVQDNDIKTLILRQNNFTQFPPSLELLTSTLTTLDISHNKLSGNTYMKNELSLPNLKSLDISHSTITSLTPLFEYLPAPKLTELTISRNRLTSLPPLRIAFPLLTSVHAADNGIVELKVESVQGLEVLDISGNEIEHLEPKLGLLGSEGLRTLLVSANRFRVPRRDVVEKGTGAILAWLKGRIPEGEM